MMRDTRLLAGALLLGAVVAAACSGGGGLTPQAPDAGQGGSPPIDQSVTFKVLVPKAPPPSTKLRHTRDTVYVSPNTGSISIQLATVNGDALRQPPPPSSGNVPKGCIGSATGCSVAVSNVRAAVGADSFSVTTYTGPNATGTIVSQGIVPVTVTAGSGNSGTIGGTTLSFGGFVAKLAMTVTPSTFYLGEPSNASVFITAQDASGATIVGDTRFAVPISVVSSPSPQFQLFLGGQQGSTLSLNGPENAHAILHMHYNGSTQVSSGSIGASSTDSNGDAITAQQNVVVLPAPSPTPTNHGSAPPTDLYVLNGADNTVVEFAGPSNAQRREFGGKVIGCPPQLAGAPNVNLVSLGSSGLAFDGGGNALVGTAISCAKPGSSESFWSLPPSAVGTAAPNAKYVSTDQNINTFVGFAYDPTLQRLDVSDSSINVYLYSYVLSGNAANQAAALGETTGAPTCFFLQGAICGDGFIAPNTFVTYQINAGTNQNGETFALDGHGTAYYPAINTTLFTFDVLGLNLPAEPAQGPAIANPVWLAAITPYSQNYGPGDANRISNYPLSVAIDGNLLFVLNYPTKQTLFLSGQQYKPFYSPAADCNSDPNATPSPAGPTLCQDTTAHEFLTAYDLSKLTGSGPVNLQPILVVGGDQFPGNGAAGAQFADRLSVGGGSVYIAEPAGTSCNASCLGSLGKTPIGRIAVYPESLTGVHINDSASSPSAVIQGTNIKFPTAAVLGPQGTGQGSARTR